MQHFRKEYVHRKHTCILHAQGQHTERISPMWSREILCGSWNSWGGCIAFHLALWVQEAVNVFATAGSESGSANPCLFSTGMMCRSMYFSFWAEESKLKNCISEAFFFHILLIPEACCGCEQPNSQTFRHKGIKQLKLCRLPEAVQWM